MDVSTTRNLGTTVLAKLVAKEKDVLGYITRSEERRVGKRV